MKEKNLKEYFNKNHLNDVTIALFVDAMVLNKEVLLPEEVRAHVEDCQHCKEEILALYEIIKKDNRIQDYENHPYLKSSSSDEKKSFQTNNLLKIAAGFILIVGIGSLIYYIFKSQKELVAPVNQITKTTDSTDRFNDNKIAETDTGNSIPSKKYESDKSSMQQTELAINMKESPLFENLIESHYRSNDIEVSFPRPGHRFINNHTIEFKFEGDIIKPLVLIIYNNKGEKITEKSNISGAKISLNKRLPSGLYYWKLLQDDDLLQVGKFFVK